MNVVDLHASDSMTIRYAGDFRMTLLTGRTFAMQVSHPAVGAGVDQFSNFRRDPLRRLREINRSGNAFMFSGREAAERESQRLRNMHRNIAGVDSRGQRFHALDPAVYGWVHTVFFDSAVAMHDLFGTPLTRAEQERLFAEWRQGGMLLGLASEDMPADVDEYFAYYARMIETTLEYNAVTRDILSGAIPRFGPLKRLPRGAWGRISAPLAARSRRLTLGTLPPAYRRKIAAYERWTAEDERWLERFRSVVKALAPRLPTRLRVSRAAYRAMHRAA
jgi:uncharacterized protein (DUF2236 family)